MKSCGGLVGGLFLASLAWSGLNLNGLAAAAPRPLPQAENFTLEGKITRLAEGKITVNTEENIIFHVVYTDKTQFKRPDGGTASSKDLRVGQHIKVVGDLDESGEVQAARIEIQPPAAEKKRLSKP